MQLLKGKNSNLNYNSGLCSYENLTCAGTVENLCFEPADRVEAAGREDLDAAAPLPVEGVQPHRLALRGSAKMGKGNPPKVDYTSDAFCI